MVANRALGHSDLSGRFHAHPHLEEVRFDLALGALLPGALPWEETGEAFRPLHPERSAEWSAT